MAEKPESIKSSVTTHKEARRIPLYGRSPRDGFSIVAKATQQFLHLRTV